MSVMMISASHSPLLDYADAEREPVQQLLNAFEGVKDRVKKFNPDLIVMFGVDHYGGHSMNCMPAFTIGVENVKAIADVGGTPGPITVPKDVAVDAVNHVRQAGVDTAVSYDMDVDHGFSQLLQRAVGGINLYPVLPIFVSCIQPPFVPFARARAMGAAVGSFIKEKLGDKRILIMGTGGLTHDPAFLFPPIDVVGPEWKAYHMFGKGQDEVPQQSWIDYQIEAHKFASQMMHEAPNNPADFGMNADWDAKFLDIYCSGNLAPTETWVPEEVVEEAGIGAMEVLAWVASWEASKVNGAGNPSVTFHNLLQEVGIGFGITEATS